jgi:hypothetical protein
MAFKCPFQQGADCPTENCALYVLVDTTTMKHQCAIVDTAWSLKGIKDDLAYFRGKDTPKK